MPRKRSNISSVSAQAKRARLRRLAESKSERKERLETQRSNSEMSRSQETQSQYAARLNCARSRSAYARSKETQEERELRLESDRLCHALARFSQTDEQNDSRLNADRTRHNLIRSLETDKARQLRLKADNVRHKFSRILENEEKRDLRLITDSKRHTLSRSLESNDKCEVRLTADRTRHEITRSLENDEEHEKRLASDRTYHNLSRIMETEEQHEFRLSANRQRYHEGVHEVNAHLTKKRHRICNMRQTQSAEQLSLQLENDRLRHIVYRLSVSNDNESTVTEPEERQWLEKEKSGFCYDSIIKYADYTHLGAMKEICTYCRAFKWKGESKGMCCSSGKVYLERIQEPPEPLKSLLNEEHPESTHFLNSLRAYNSAFQMTSFGASKITEGAFMPTFKVLGQVYHLIGSLLPIDVPKFLQIYFMADYQDQINLRAQHIPNLKPGLLSELQNMLHNINPYVKSFKAALESVPDKDKNNYKFVVAADKRPSGAHAGRYNAPTTNEVAVLLIDQECNSRDIVLRTYDNRLQRISETHRSYDSLQYPLMFCHGEDGYNFAIYNIDPQTGAPNFNKKTSALQFYSFLIQLRQDEHIYLHRFRGLFNQFLVDMYAKIETERLVFIRTNQKQLRVDNYVDLRDALHQDSNAENVGRMTILPSTFTGGPRYMHERTQDAFCYVRKYGGADLFVTMTTNPKWPEIVTNLLPGQSSYDRHDLISRVFHLKQKRLIDILTKEKLFGNVRCYMYSIEWQKRGLPHSHNLIWLDENIRPNDIDKVIRAEIPDPKADPILHKIVKSNMVHGPCGSINMCSPCMKNGRCKMKFPKSFVKETVTGQNGYPLYKRRPPYLEGGFTAEVNVRGQSVVVDNRWIVPYSPVLSRTFEAHVNVEYCASVESIKYICKYVNKGSDQVTVGVQSVQHDEVTNYQSGRYISTSEAVWRILSFPIHERYPTVMHLDVHLENGQRVYFNRENVQERLENPRQTTLLAFFKLCQEDNFARTIMYNEVPSYYTFDKQRGVFNRRRRGQAVEGFPGVLKEHALGRIYTVHPSNTECYYLRLLLHTVRGPTSFRYLRTVEGIEYATFHAACRALRLLDDDQNWHETLEEAIVSDRPNHLRHLFAIMLVFCELSNPVQLWEKYRRHLMEDFLLANRNTDVESELETDERSVNSCLHSIQEIVNSISGNPLTQYGLPNPQQHADHPRVNREFAAEMKYNSSALTNFVNDNIVKLTNEQRLIYDKVLGSVNLQQGEAFFLDAPGGTGKTFLTALLLAEVRRQGKIAVAVASSGIAATLLPGGKTAHTMFKIPIHLESSETPVCAISRSSDKAKVIEECCLIVWDECTMANKKAVEAVNRTLQDIRRDYRIMGGITILFCGDFRQTLPVVAHGTRADEVNASLKRSAIWPEVQKLYLTRNMRAQLGGSSRAKEFSDVLLKLGEGSLPELNGQVNLDETLCKIVHSVDELIHSVYGDITQVTRRENFWLCGRAILTPKNEQATAINCRILQKIAGKEMVYNSINTVLDKTESTTYPVEFLNSLCASGIPAHTITLKVGIPIMLLRNLTPPKLCNGTRLKVVSLNRNVIEAEILTGCGAGDVVFIPRIPLIPSNFPFQFKRVQFPVSVCFAMTINKSQGQTLYSAGVDLRTSCFSHGQLYVACSRVTSADNLFVLTDFEKTDNVVYREILQ